MRHEFFIFHKKMTTKRKDSNLPSSVTVAFFGLLLALSLVLNIGIFLKLENSTPGISSDSSFPGVSQTTLKKKVENGKVWVELPDPIFDAYFLSDKTCKTCVDIDSMISNFERTYPTARIKPIDVSSNTGKELIDAGASVVPAIILSRSFQNIAAFPEVAQAGVVAPVGEKYYEYRTNGNKKILNENQLPVSMRGSDTLKIIGYTDFFSPESAAFSTVVPQIAAQFGNDISVENNAFVTDIPSAFIAEAVQCGVNMQTIIDTRDEYAAAIKKIAEGKKSLGDEELDQISTQLKQILGMDEATAACYDQHRYLEEVQRIAQEAQSLGINGAPAYFVGNRFLAGPQSAEVFSSAIAEVIEERKNNTSDQDKASEETIPEAKQVQKTEE